MGGPPDQPQPPLRHGLQRPGRGLAGASEDQNSTIDWNLSQGLTGLVNGATYALDWWARVNGDFVLYEYATWEASQENNTFLWDLQIDNSTTCELEIRYRMFVDSSDTSVPNWLHMREDGWYWYPGCDEWVYPEDSYVNIYADVNGTWEELDDWSETTNSSHVLPAGEHDIEVRFENLSVGATYRLYLYHSGTGFYDESEHHYFTYDGTPMGLTIPVAPWACDIYFSWDMQLYDFRYPDNYNSWWMGSDSMYVDGPCQSMSYDWGHEPTFEVEVDIENSTMTISADDLQDMFPYTSETLVSYDGHLNHFESHSWFGDNASTEEEILNIDVPGFVCDVYVRSYMFVWTGDGSNSQTNSTENYFEGPCDGSMAMQRCSSPCMHK